MTGSGANPRIEFRDFVLDTAARSLSCQGLPIPLSPKELDTLIVLVEHAGEAIDKDTLVARAGPTAL
jgi:DNA-binding winged helix-turn-helix (wHTH) protein